MKKKYVVLLVAINLLVSFAFSQEISYSVVNVEDININGFKYGDNIEKCKEIFGSPLNYKVYKQDDGLGPEGRDVIYYLTYEEIRITFFEYQKKIFLDNININTDKYQLLLKDVKICIGDSLTDFINEFPESANVLEENLKKNEVQEQEFIVSIRINNNNYLFYGLINIKLYKGIVTRITLSFDQGT